MRVGDIAYEVDGVAMVGRLAVDDQANERRPAVLVCHEANGMGANVSQRAEMLAELGYAAFALDCIDGGATVDFAVAGGRRAGGCRASPTERRAIVAFDARPVRGDDRSVRP
jgi:dienelactone hydrolase